MYLGKAMIMIVLGWGVLFVIRLVMFWIRGGRRHG